MMCRVFEYETHNNNSELLATSEDNKVWHSDDEGSTWTDVTGAATVTDPYMQWINFKDFAFGFQDGDVVLKWDGAVLTDFTPTVGDIAQGGVALSAFGRIWAVDESGTFLQYSALLNEEDWDFADPTSDAGGFELKNVWEGTDTVVGLVEFNGQLVVMGEENILIWSDGQGSEVGLDPLSMYIVDTLHGVGCYARDSIVEVDAELMWLSKSGVQRLSRVVEQRSNPLLNFSRHVHDDLLRRARNTDRRQIHALYSPEERFVYWAFPDPTNGPESGETYCFDSRGTNPDESGRCVGVWDVITPKCSIRLKDSQQILMFCGEASPPPNTQLSLRTFTENVAGTYEGYTDPRNDPADPIVPYSMVYESGWNNLETPYLKIPKKFRGIFYTIGSSDGLFNVWYDFDKFKYPTYARKITADGGVYFYTDPQSPPGTLAPAAPESTEFNDSFGGVDDQVDPGGNPVQAGEYTGGYKPVIVPIPGVQGAGEYVKLGVQVRIAGFPMSMQELSLYLKQGRLI